MIGALPKSLNINGKDYEINSDYRVCLLILQAFNDYELTQQEQFIVMIKCLFVNHEDISDEDMEEAINKAVWFLNCGNDYSNKMKQKRVYDWEQDEQIIFSSINKVAQKEVRSLDYLHFWSFMGYFNEIGEGTFQTVVSIRTKKNQHKKLEKWEQEFARKNPDVVKLNTPKSKEDMELLDALDKYLKGE